jgi:hypothetical protein
MKKALLMCLLAVGVCGGALAQMGAGNSGIAPGSMVEPSVSMNALMGNVEKQTMALANAMPADKYDFAPSAAIFAPGHKVAYDGVRTFAAICTHIAQANYGMASRIGAMKPDVDVAGLAKLHDKEQVVKALGDSFAFVHKAMGTLTKDNAFESVNGPMTRIAFSGFVVAHTEDEYGQMVEYARMNGIVPPASAK